MFVNVLLSVKKINIFLKLFQLYLPQSCIISIVKFTSGYNSVLFVSQIQNIGKKPFLLNPLVEFIFNIQGD